MPDVWSSVAELGPEVQECLADILETRGADRQQQRMRRAFLVQIEFPTDAEVLEVGCGTGVLTRVLASLEVVREVVGVDIAPSLLAKARELAAELPTVRFERADARSLPFADGRFDVVVFDSTLSHVPEPEGALAETFRVLRPDGWLAVFDGDYATATVALSDHDPLQFCVDAMMAGSVHDRRVMRRLPALADACGFQIRGTSSHGYVETGDGEYCRPSSTAEPTYWRPAARSVGSLPRRSRPRRSDGRIRRVLRPHRVHQPDRPQERLIHQHEGVDARRWTLARALPTLR
ncbi:MAG: methyltransferase domain-containing protein [Nocardioidaceae bacterium]